MLACNVKYRLFLHATFRTKIVVWRQPYEEVIRVALVKRDQATIKNVILNENKIILPYKLNTYNIYNECLKK